MPQAALLFERRLGRWEVIGLEVPIVPDVVAQPAWEVDIGATYSLDVEGAGFINPTQGVRPR